jgi:hypothetical protein
MSVLGNYKKKALSRLLLLDKYPSTMPFYSLNKCLLTSFIGTACIDVVVNDGDTNPTYSYAFGNDLQLPLAQMETDAAGDTMLLKKVRMHNTSDFFEQNTIANMPIIGEDLGSGWAINRDEKGKVSAKLTNGRSMNMPSSAGILNRVHNGTICSQLFQLERASGTTRSYAFVNRPSAGTVGFFVALGTFFSVANRLSYRVESPASTAYFTTDTCADNVGHTIFSTVDITNATTNQRIINDIDGTVFNSNPTGGSVTPSTIDASFNLTMGSVVSGFEFIGNISTGGWWESDQSSNKADILTYL